MRILLVSATILFATVSAINDTDCTANGAYTNEAVNCQNMNPDSVCSMIFEAGSPIKAGGTEERPLLCYKDSGLKSFAIDSCPKTCGFCCKKKSETKTTTPSTPGCTDTAICDTQMCVTRGLEEEVRKYCRKTCGLCGNTIPKPVATAPPPAPPVAPPAAPCVDKKTLCAEWKRNGFCTHTWYTLKEKKEVCARTCNLCDTVVTSSSTCEDRSPTCRSWANNGFCTNSFYTSEDKKYRCARTCGFC